MLQMVDVHKKRTSGRLTEQRALAKSGQSTDDATKYKIASATMQLKMKC